MHTRLIVLDFDHTVFNTTQYVQALRDHFKAVFNIAETTFDEARQAVKDCCVVIDMDTFVQLLPYSDKAALHQAHHDVIQKEAKRFVFSDVHAFIEKHTDAFDIVVTTHGDTELQEEKISHSTLPDEVSWIISTKPKDKVVEPFVKQYTEIHFIDDKAKNIDAVKRAFPEVITYFIQRPEDHPYADDPSECACVDRVIRGLDIDLH